MAGCTTGSTRPPSTTTEEITGTTRTPTTSAASTSTTNAGPPPPSNICKQVGINPDPNNDCTNTFYMCTEGENGEWEIDVGECPLDLIFNPAIGVCDFLANVEGCQH